LEWYWADSGSSSGCLGVALALPALAADRPGSGSISGYVRSATGVPQMGALVEVLGSAAYNFKVFTDENGFYSASGLLPGVYNVKAYSPSFLPALRERVGLRPGSSVMVNLKLSGLFDAVQMPTLRGPADDDDWKWVLRSASNRPILRMLEDGTLATAAESGAYKGSGDKSDKHDLKGTLSFVAGSASGGFGSTSDMNTGFFRGEVALLFRNGGLGGECWLQRRFAEHGSARFLQPCASEWFEAGDGVYHAPSGCAWDQTATVRRCRPWRCPHRMDSPSATFWSCVLEASYKLFNSWDG